MASDFKVGDYVRLLYIYQVDDAYGYRVGDIGIVIDEPEVIANRNAVVRVSISKGNETESGLWYAEQFELVKDITPLEKVIYGLD